MNRAERRRQGKAGADPVYTLRKSDIDKIKLTATQQAVDTVMLLLLSIPVKVMREKFGWGEKKRLPEFADAILDEYEAFSNGERELDEYREMVWETCGVRFEKVKEG